MVSQAAALGPAAVMNLIILKVRMCVLRVIACSFMCVGLSLSVKIGPGLAQRPAEACAALPRACTRQRGVAEPLAKQGSAGTLLMRFMVGGIIHYTS